MPELIQGLDELGIDDEDILGCEFFERDGGGEILLRFTPKAQALIDDYCKLMNITSEQLIRAIAFPDDGH